MRLTELKVGEKGRIVKIGNVGDLKRRLREMGVTTGEIIEVENIAPLGDPVEVIVRNTRLSLRMEEAENIEVEKL